MLVSFKKLLLMVILLSMSVLFVSCWDSDSEDDNPIGTTNTAPVWLDSAHAVSSTLGDTVKLDLQDLVTDSENDSLFFSILNSPTIGSINGDFLTFKVPSDTVAIYNFTVTVSDGSLLDTIAITINIDNEAPLWTDSVYTNEIVKGTPFTINLSTISSDVNIMNTLSYSILGTASGIDIITDTIYTITAVDSTDSVYSVQIAVTDGMLADTAIFNFKITNDNSAPVWADTVYNFNIVKGTAFIVDFSTMASDVDSLDVLSYTILNDISSIDTIIGSSYHITADSTVDSTYSALIQVSDGILTDTTKLVFSISEGNKAPLWIDTLFTYNTTFDTDYTIDLSAISSDPDTQDALTYSIIGAASGLDSIIGSTYKLNAPVGTTSPYIVNVVVSDGIFSDTAKFAVSLFSGNVAPYWSASSYNYTVTKGKSFDINLAEISDDPDSGDVITYSILGTSSGIDAIADTVYSITADSATAASYVVSLEISDGLLKDTTVFNFTVLEPNKAPVFTVDMPKALYAIEEGDSVEFSVEATDADLTDTVIVSVQSTGTLPNANTATFVNGVFKWKSQVGESGSYVITFVATDGEDSTTATATINVGAVNNVPVITVENAPNGAASVNEGESLTINFTFSDLDASDKLTVTDVLPTVSGLTITYASDSSTAAITYSPDFNTVINASSKIIDTIVVSVTDGEDSDVEKIVVTVNNVNRAPQFEANSPAALYSVTVGNTLTIPFSATDADTEDVVIIDVDETTFKSGADITVVGNTIVWNTALADIGHDTIALSATDGEDVTNIKVAVSVNEDNGAPTITVDGHTDGEVITITEEGNVNFTVVATPKVVGDVVTLSPVGIFNPAGSFNTITGAFSFDASYAMASIANPDTVFGFQFSAKGSGSQAATAQFSISIKVTNVNRAPVFNNNEPAGLYSIVVGNTLKIPFGATDVDPEDVVTIDVDESTFKTGADISVVGDTIVWNTAIGDIGTDTISLSATDGAAVTAAKVAVSVNEDNTAPTITIGSYTNGEVITITEEESESFTVVATPAVQGDAVTLSTVGALPTGASFNASTGAFTFNANYNMASLLSPSTDYAIQFSAKGSASNAATAQFSVTIKVNNVNRAPVFTPTVPGNANVGLGNDYSAPIVATDPDGDPLTYTFSKPGFSYSNGNVIWNADMASHIVGGFVDVIATVSDGDLTAQTSSWRLNIVEHVWEHILTIAGMEDLVASNEDSIYIGLPDYKWACYSGDGATKYNEVDYNVYLPYIYDFSAVQYGDRIIQGASHPQGGGYINFNINNDVIEVDGGGAGMQSSFYATHVRDLDVTISNQHARIKAARTGVTIFGFTNDDKKILRKFATTDNFDTVATGNFSTKNIIEFGSDDGNICYFTDVSNRLLLSQNGLNSGSISVSYVSGAPDSITAISAMNDSTAWILDESGKVYFSAHFFKSSNYHQEVIGDGSEVIKKVVVSDDRKTVYVVAEASSGSFKVYKY